MTSTQNLENDFPTKDLPTDDHDQHSNADFFQDYSLVKGNAEINKLIIIVREKIDFFYM